MKGGAARPCTSAWLGEDDWIAESAIGQKYAYSMKPSAVLEHTTILSSALRAHEGHCHRGGLHNEEDPGLLPSKMYSPSIFICEPRQTSFIVPPTYFWVVGLITKTFEPPLLSLKNLIENSATICCTPLQKHFSLLHHHLYVLLKVSARK